MNFSLLRNRAGDARSIFRSPAGRAGLISIIVGAILIVIVTAVWVTAIFGGGPEAQNNSASPVADPVAASPVADPGNQGVVTTLAGPSEDIWADDYSGSDEFSDEFSAPHGVAVGPDGTVYTTETEGGRISKITPDGVVTTLAGSIGYGSDGGTGAADGAGTAARFNMPEGIAVDVAGVVYVADTGNGSIRKISPAGVVTTLPGSGTHGLVDGVLVDVGFWGPKGVAVDSGGTVYVADGHSISKISPAGVVTVLAGSDVDGVADGTGAAALFSYPAGVAVDASGTVYVADTGNRSIRKITPEGVVTTLAGPGGGVFGGAQLYSPRGVAVDAAGTVYVSDAGNEDGDHNGIRKITSAGMVTTLAGGTYGFADGTGTAARFRAPQGVAVDSKGVIYVSDRFNDNVRKVQ